MKIEKYKYKTLLFSFDSMIRLSCHNFLFCCKSLRKLCETFPTKTFSGLYAHIAQICASAQTLTTQTGTQKGKPFDLPFLFLITFMRFS